MNRASNITSLLDSASDLITSLQATLKKLKGAGSAPEDGLLQQYLDEESLYIKQIPRDYNNVYRALSDALYFTQAQYQGTKKSYIINLRKHKTVRELELLVAMLTAYSSIQSYIEALAKGFYTPLVDVVLFCAFSNLDVTVYYSSQEGLAKMESNFGFNSNIKLYMTHSGFFDTMYNKSYIRAAGLCQSVILDLLTPNTSKKSPGNAVVYQNLEYTRWKESEQVKNIPIPRFFSAPEDESEEKAGHTPGRSVSDNHLWRFFEEGATKKPTIVPKPLKPVFPSRASSSINLAQDPSKLHHFTPSPPAPSYSHTYPFMYGPPTMYVPVVASSPQWQYPNGYLTGRLKFFDETQQYGFFILDTDGTDLFVHYDDLIKSGISLAILQQAKIKDYHFAFQCMTYYGKYQLSRKAVNIQLLNPANSRSKVVHQDYTAVSNNTSKI